jgi:hypothetical protein
MKATAKALYLALPLLPWWLLMREISGEASGWFNGWHASAFSLSVLLGIAAAVWATGQLYLSAKPFGLGKWLGQDKLLSLHALSGLLVVAAAACHLALKLFALGYSLGPQASLGLAALGFFAMSSLGAWIFMSPAAAKKHPRIAALRKAVQEEKGATYKKFRLIHNAVFLPLLILPMHVILSSAVPDAGAAKWFMAGWFLVGIAIQLRYRIRGRKA